jgi:hypothetical protein
MPDGRLDQIITCADQCISHCPHCSTNFPDKNKEIYCNDIMEEAAAFVNQPERSAENSLIAQQLAGT